MMDQKQREKCLQEVKLLQVLIYVYNIVCGSS